MNATFARIFGGEINVGGRTLQLNVVGKPLETTWFKGTVVGVVQDLVFTKVNDPPVPQVFVLAGPSGAFPYNAFPYIAIRIPGGLDGSQRLKSSLEDVWGPLPADRFVALKDFWSAGLLPYTGQAKLVGMLALFAIPLALIGVTSFMLFIVRSEHRAVAIRLAIGAEPRQIMKEVLAKGAVTVAAGVGIGAAVGIGLGRILSARLLGVDALDPASLALTVVCFGVMGMSASVAPARIAASANPAVLLREDGD